MFRILAAIGLFLATVSTLSAQEYSVLCDPKGVIKELKNGVVLVRLRTDEVKISALKERGLDAEAARLEREIALEHLEIAMAFREKFDFCNVFFFYSNYSERVKEGDLSGILMDHDLSPVDLDPKFYIVADFNFTPQKRIGGLLAYCSNMENIPTPFPNFTRNNWFPILAPRTKADVVAIWNKRLHKFYGR
jgi:hypothetical protein